MLQARAALARFAALPLLATSILLGTACAPPIQVDFDPGEDLSGFRTWGWRPNVAATLASPSGRRSPLNDLLARTIAGELEGHGYERDDGAPDLVVGYGVEVQRRTVLTQVPRAPYLLSSLSSSPSYWVEGTNIERQRVADVTVEIEIADARGRRVWAAESRHRIQATEKIDLRAALVALLETFPSRPAPAEVR